MNDPLSKNATYLAGLVVTHLDDDDRYVPVQQSTLHTLARAILAQPGDENTAT